MKQIGIPDDCNIRGWNDEFPMWAMLQRPEQVMLITPETEEVSYNNHIAMRVWSWGLVVEIHCKSGSDIVRLIALPDTEMYTQAGAVAIVDLKVGDRLLPADAEVVKRDNLYVGARFTALTGTYGRYCLIDGIYMRIGAVSTRKRKPKHGDRKRHHGSKQRV